MKRMRRDLLGPTHAASAPGIEGLRKPHDWNIACLIFNGQFVFPQIAALFWSIVSESRYTLCHFIIVDAVDDVTYYPQHPWLQCLVLAVLPQKPSG